MLFTKVSRELNSLNKNHCQCEVKVTAFSLIKHQVMSITNMQSLLFIKRLVRFNYHFAFVGISVYREGNVIHIRNDDIEIL